MEERAKAMEAGMRAVDASLTGASEALMSWEWLEKNKNLVPDLTLFDNWDILHAHVKWFVEGNLLTNVRVLSHPTRARHPAATSSC